MFLRRTQTTSHGRRYDYIHLVESYRRPDGRPTHRILANVTDWPPEALRNLEISLQASRQGQRVVVASAPSSAKRPPKVAANLRYLDVAIFLRLWNQWKLNEMLHECLGDRLASDVVASLVLQRCVEPDSKLAATRWFPKTALPQLLGIAPKQFNNTRIHRVLHDLEQATPALMAKLPTRYQARDGAFASLFMDATDTWFEGAGPPSAQRGKTKEGMARKKIGIVLLCNERGYPVRWQVIPGNQNESRAMTQMFEAIGGLPWVGHAPVVVDRALGNTAHLRNLQQTRVRFLTALVKTEFGNYAPELPCDRFVDLQGAIPKTTLIARAAQRIKQAGFRKVSDTLFFSDLGVVTYVGDSSQKPASSTEAHPTTDRTVHAMGLCRQMVQMVADGQAGSLTAAGQALGLGQSGVVWKYLTLRHLTQEIQEAILQGKAVGRTLVELGKLAKRPHEEQPKAFETLLARPASSAISAVDRPSTSTTTTKPLEVRAVAYFNPESFAHQRDRAQQKVDAIREFVNNLNTSLASRRSHRTRNSIVAHIDQRLRRDDLLDAFDVTVFETTIDGSCRFQVQLTLHESNWVKRRWADGFTVLVAHPALEQTADELCRLYRAKDHVEKDFQVIKSVLDLRPVRHHTDHKVRAHVTLCMLALLLERTLRDELRGKYTVHEARELLDVRLNEYKTSSGRAPVYTLTELTPAERALIKHLKARDLADDDSIAEQIARATRLS